MSISKVGFPASTYCTLPKTMPTMLVYRFDKAGKIEEYKISLKPLRSFALCVELNMLMGSVY